MQTDQIDISIDRILELLPETGQQFTTADVIRWYSGGFCTNVGTPAYYSINAQFGKLLQRNHHVLRIEETEPNVPITDDHGHPTSTSRWLRT